MLQTLFFSIHSKEVFLIIQVDAKLSLAMYWAIIKALLTKTFCSNTLLVSYFVAFLISGYDAMCLFCVLRYLNLSTHKK